MRTFVTVCVLLLVLAVLGVTAGTKEDMKQACDMCGNINMGGGGKKSQYVCPKSAVKDCNININGWCCSPKRTSPKCKPCWNLSGDDEEEDDEM